MSFLNPVNEPVKRFKSTDAGAPQINYNARVAGDVKAVLKACLVTGYGATASAGWSVVNEVDHVAEFVSPSTTMIDYRLGIDDTSTSSTTWYYQYQDARIDPRYNKPVKDFSNADKSHVDNSWQLIVSARGLLFIEILQHSAVKKPSARITYFSQIKSMLSGVETHNMMFFNFGHNGQIDRSSYFHSASYPYYKLNNYTAPNIIGSLPLVDDYGRDATVVDVTTPLYIIDSTANIIVAEITGLLAQTISRSDDIYKQRDVTLDGRNYISVCTGYAYPTAQYAAPRARNFLIPLDYWGY